LLWIFNKQSVEFSKQSIELVWHQSQPSQTVSNPFQKPLSNKLPIEMTKQQVVFPLLYKTIFFKKVLIPNCFRFKQRVDYTPFYPKPTHTHSNSSLPSNTMDLETSKLQDHPWSTIVSSTILTQAHFNSSPISCVV